MPGPTIEAGPAPSKNPGWIKTTTAEFFPSDRCNFSWKRAIREGGWGSVVVGGMEIEVESMFRLCLFCLLFFFHPRDESMKGILGDSATDRTVGTIGNICPAREPTGFIFPATHTSIF